FFFQAEDGIRDRTVTGVQTCALPILPPVLVKFPPDAPSRIRFEPFVASRIPVFVVPPLVWIVSALLPAPLLASMIPLVEFTNVKIGRASCRERVEVAVVAMSLRAEWM